jgi:hypothetical protein
MNIELIKQRIEIERQINELDENALINYEIQRLREN